MNEPDFLVTNSTTTWNEQWDAYPAPTWSCIYTINGPVKLSITGAALGSSFQITITPAQSKTLAPGMYAYQAVVTSGTQSFVASQGTILVKQGLADIAAGQEVRTVNKQILDALEASMINAATRDQLEMQIGGRSIKYMSLGEKIKAVNFYRREVKSEKIRERAANGSDDPGGRINVRFTQS